MASRSMLLPLQWAVLWALVSAPFGCSAQRKPLPEFLHVCKRSDEHLDSCIKESIEHLRPFLVKGIPELNVPPTDPMYLRQLVLNDNPTLRLSARDIRAYRTSEFEVVRLKTDLEKGVFFCRLRYQGMYIEGLYSVSGRVMLLPLKGEGPMTLNISKTMADVKIFSEIVDRNGVQYINFTKLDVRIYVSGGSIRLKNLFGGDQMLGELVNNAINVNFEHFLAEVRPAVERALSSTFLTMAQRVAASYPLDDLLLPD